MPWPVEGALLLVASSVGAAVGFRLHLQDGGVAKTEISSGKSLSNRRFLIGNGVGIAGTMLTAYCLLLATFPLRGRTIEVLEWGMKVRAYDEEVDLLVRFAYFAMVIGAARAWYLTNQSSWWRAIWSGCYVGATIVGCLSLAFH